MDYEKRGKFSKWIHDNYDIEYASNMLQEKRTRKSISTKVYWNNSRQYPNVGDYVTDINAGPSILTYVAKIISRSKGKRPYYDIEILYSWNGKNKEETERIDGCMLAILEKKEHWKEFSK
jgi:hypothetical protein